MQARSYRPPFGNWPRLQVQIPLHRIWRPGLPLAAPTSDPTKQRQMCDLANLSIGRLALEAYER